MAAPAAAPPGERLAAIVRHNDETLRSALDRQNTDPESRWRGAIPDEFGLHEPGSASGILLRGVAALLHPQSQFHGSAELVERLRLAAEHLARVQTPDGNFDLLITNFNSPPDTAFVMRNVCVAATLAREAGRSDLFERMAPTIRKAGAGIARGGVHTPNHRWVVSAALAQIHSLFPNPDYVRRIDQWLAEGIDIDSDGQFSEQSTTVYNAVTDDALTTIALHLDRPALLEPVRRNLETMLYLLHPNYEVVTSISKRQDRDVVGTMGRYWFSLRCLARKDGDGRFETLARAFEPQHASLAHLMAYPELRQPGPDPQPVPDSYERSFPQSDLVHIRRGETSAVILLEGRSRFFELRRGEAVVEAVRFASAFFGKGQFIPSRGFTREGAYRLEQELEAPYWQPFESRKQPWGVEAWHELRAEREQSEINRLRYAAEIRERAAGFDLRIEASGVDWIPLTVEINLREGGQIEGVEAAPGADEAWVPAANEIRYSRNGDALTIGPAFAAHRYTQVRGAEPKLAGPSVYLTAYTPVDRTIELRWKKATS